MSDSNDQTTPSNGPTYTGAPGGSQVPPQDPAAAQTPPGVSQPAPDPQYQQQPGPGQQGAGYAAAPGGMPQGQPGAFNPQQAFSNLQLNYWLSAFFGWLPALIFYVVDKAKQPVLDSHLKNNLNFQILRTAAGLGAYLFIFLSFIPEIGWVFSLIGSLAFFAIGIGGLVLTIMAAVKAPEEYRAGRTYDYPVNFPLVK